MKYVFVILVMTVAVFSCVSGQTFQYSKGWTVGKRALDEDVAPGTSDNKVFLSTGQLLIACRNFIKIHREADDYLGLGSNPKVLKKRGANAREFQQKAK